MIVVRFRLAMTASAKFSLKFSIGLPDYRETHEDLHCETVVLDDCGGWLSSSLLSRFHDPRSVPEARVPDWIPIGSRVGLARGAEIVTCGSL